jgi:hypothetical protein
MKRIRKYKEAPKGVIVQGLELRLSMISDKSDASEIIISYLSSHPTLSKDFLNMLENKYPELVPVFEKYSLLI